MTEARSSLAPASSHRARASASRTTWPGLYESLLETSVLPFGDRLLGTTFVHNLRALRRFDTFTSAELAQLQEHRLARMLRHATQRCPYYRSLWSYNEESTPQQNLKAFPVLTKSSLRENTSGIFAASGKALTPVSSSGSTGVRSTVFYAPDDFSMTRALQVHWWEWSGYRVGSKLLQTGITPQRGTLKWIKDVLLRTFYVPAFAISRDEIASILTRARRAGIRHFFGYASSLYTFAEVAEERSIGATFDAIVTWGDKLFPHYRRKLEHVFGAKVFETYGCAEGLMIAAQKDLEYLYIMTPNIYLELLDDDGDEVPDGTMGHVVVTNLTAESFPLIRYRLGDLAIKLPRELYPPGTELNYPLLQKVVGRDTDLVRTPAGRSLVVHSFTGVFEHVPEIRQFCVIQSEIRGITIQYIPSDSFRTDVLEAVKRKLEGFIQEPFGIEFQQVDVIPPTSSGKPQIVVSRL